MKRTTNTARLFTRCLGPAALAALALAACSDDATTTTTLVPLPPRIAVTSVKGDPESQLMAAIYARVLEDNGFRVARKDPIELDRAGYFAAIQDGQFQLIPDHTFDLLDFIYSQPGSEPAPTTSVPSGPATTQAPILITTTTEAPTTTVADTTGDTTADTTGDTTPAGTSTTVIVDTTVADTVAETTPAETTTTDPNATTTTEAPIANGRTVAEQVIAINSGAPSPLHVNNGASAEKKSVIACTAEAMDANAGTQFITLTDLASIAPNIRLAGNAAYVADDALGYPALQRYYGGEFKDIVTVEDDAVAEAVTNGDADCFALNSLNPIIGTEGMTILLDDKVMIPSNAVVALVNGDVTTPEAIFALDSISSALTTERLNQMLNEIINNGADPVVVANAFVDTLTQA
ncbi:MAG: glycine betaine ABC transporter substrate-binding protein [Ilumatobacteraceae bacterium]